MGRVEPHRARCCAMSPVYFRIMHGLRGCYMPDTNEQYCVSSLREMASIIRDELEFFDAPKHRFRDVGIRKIWAFIRHARSASQVYILIPTTGGCALEVVGMTAAEYEEEAHDEL